MFCNFQTNHFSLSYGGFLMIVKVQDGWVENKTSPAQQKWGLIIQIWSLEEIKTNGAYSKYMYRFKIAL